MRVTAILAKQNLSGNAGLSGALEIGGTGARMRLAPPNSGRLRDRRHRWGRNTLVQRGNSGIPAFQLQVTWGMSAIITIRYDEEIEWLDWGARTDRDLPRYKTYLSTEEIATRGLLQGTLVHLPGASVVPHWHSPVETYFVLAGEGMSHMG